LTAKNHFLFSVSVVSLTLGTLDPFVLLIAGGMSLLPDIDSSKSVVGKVLFPVSRLIERHFPHRTFTHSFFFTAILAIGLIPLAFEGKDFYFAALIGFFCGWFLDVFTKAGVSAFYPMSMARLVIPANPALRLSTGSKNEWLFSVIFLALIVISFQLHSSGGVMQIFSSLLAQPTGVAELYLAHSNKNRIYVNLSGQTSSGEISGKYEVVALQSNNTFLIRRENFLLIVGDSNCLQCHVRSNSAKGEIGETVYVTTQEVRLNEQPIQKLIEHFSGREILISGELTLPNEELQIPLRQMQFNPVTITAVNPDAKQARLEHASLEDLRPLSRFAATGNLIVKTISQ
jgi:inner membrane protein